MGVSSKNRIIFMGLIKRVLPHSIQYFFVNKDVSRVRDGGILNENQLGRIEGLTAHFLEYQVTQKDE